MIKCLKPDNYLPDLDDFLILFLYLYFILKGMVKPLISELFY